MPENIQKKHNAHTWTTWNEATAKISSCLGMPSWNSPTTKRNKIVSCMTDEEKTTINQAPFHKWMPLLSEHATLPKYFWWLTFISNDNILFKNQCSFPNKISVQLQYLVCWVSNHLNRQDFVKDTKTCFGTIKQKMIAWQNLATIARFAPPSKNLQSSSLTAFFTCCV